MQVEEKCCTYELKEKDKKKETNELIEEEKVFPSSLYDTIHKVAEKEGFTNYELSKRFISTEGGNYLGVLYEVDLKGKTAEGDKETNLFLKYAINGDKIKIFSVSEVYMKESYVYKNLSKIFNELQNEAEIPAEERYKMPKSYESNREVIILDNLAKKGFSTYNRMDCMSLSFAELSLEQLAKFHGLFYVIEKKRPEYFNKHLKVWTTLTNFNDDFNIFIKNMCDLSKQSVNDEHKEKLEKYVPRILEKLPKFYQEPVSMGCTICHGDFRTNNILVRDTNSEALEVVPVDYQTLYYGCPVNDFMYFIFIGSDREFRKKHFAHLKNHYYNSLAKFLNYFNMDIEKIYPKNEFEIRCKDRLEFGLMTALFVTPFLFTVEDSVPDIGKDDIKDLSFVLNPRVHERIQGLIKDLVENGFL